MNYCSVEFKNVLRIVERFSRLMVEHRRFIFHERSQGFGRMHANFKFPPFCSVRSDKNFTIDFTLIGFNLESYLHHRTYVYSCKFFICSISRVSQRYFINYGIHKISFFTIFCSVFLWISKKKKK